MGFEYIKFLSKYGRILYSLHQHKIVRKQWKEYNKIPYDINICKDVN